MGLTFHKNPAGFSVILLRTEGGAVKETEVICQGESLHHAIEEFKKASVRRLFPALD